jgi:hypothetical protein
MGLQLELVRRGATNLSENFHSIRIRNYFQVASLSISSLATISLSGTSPTPCVACIDPEGPLAGAEQH